jgi:hypothetical protein
MKIKIALFYIVFFLTPALAQFTSLDVIYDARSIAMGESSVASTNGLNPVDVNPASLIGINGLSFTYSHRNANLFDFTFVPEINKDMNCYSMGIGLKSSIGYFAFSYKKFNQHKILGYEIPGIYPNYLNTADHTNIGTYANNFFKNFYGGINVKTHWFSVDLPNNTYTMGSNNPVLFDLGIIYKINGILKSENLNDNLNLAASINNPGTKYRLIQGKDERKIELPHYIRIGFSYELNFPDSQNKNLFSFILNGEYRNLLNHDFDDIGEYIHGFCFGFGSAFYGFWPNFDYEGCITFGLNDNERDFWSFGAEASFYDILFLRMGGIANPFTSVYGEAGVFSFRYGAGLKLPLSVIGIKYPVSFSFDYAVIPLNNLELYVHPDNLKNFDAFNIGMNWDIMLF